MVAIPNSSIDLRFFIPSFEFKFKDSFVDGIKSYIVTIKKIFFLKKTFRFIIDDFDNFIDRNRLDSSEKLEKVEEEFYQIEEQLEELLELDGVLFYPIRKIAQEAIYDCSSLATLLTGIEADLRVLDGDR